MRVNGSFKDSGGLRVESVFAQRFAFMFANVRNRSREPRMAVPMVSSAKGVALEVSHVALLRFAWQGWHFVTFPKDQV